MEFRVKRCVDVVLNVRASDDVELLQVTRAFFQTKSVTVQGRHGFILKMLPLTIEGQQVIEVLLKHTGEQHCGCKLVH